jgi:hypothetical protein
MRSFDFVLIVCFVFIFIIDDGIAMASTKFLTLEEIVNLSDVIVIGKVHAINSEENNKSSILASIKAISILKGSSLNRIILIEWNKNKRIEDKPKIKVGNSYFLFLYKKQNGINYGLVGNLQGYYKINNTEQVVFEGRLLGKSTLIERIKSVPKMDKDDVYREMGIDPNIVQEVEGDGYRP